MSSIKERGAADYFRWQGKYQNPFAPGSAEFNEYERGWTQSMKRNGATLIKFDDFGPAPTVDVRVEKAKVNAYAELKGRIRPRDGT